MIVKNIPNWIKKSTLILGCFFYLVSYSQDIKTYQNCVEGVSYYIQTNSNHIATVTIDMSQAHQNVYLKNITCFFYPVDFNLNKLRLSELSYVIKDPSVFNENKKYMVSLNSKAYSNADGLLGSRIKCDCNVKGSVFHVKKIRVNGKDSTIITSNDQTFTDGGIYASNSPAFIDRKSDEELSLEVGHKTKSEKLPVSPDPFNRFSDALTMVFKNAGNNFENIKGVFVGREDGMNKYKTTLKLYDNSFRGLYIFQNENESKFLFENEKNSNYQSIKSSILMLLKSAQIKFEYESSASMAFERYTWENNRYEIYLGIRKYTDHFIEINIYHRN